VFAGIFSYYSIIFFLQFFINNSKNSKNSKILKILKILKFKNSKLKLNSTIQKFYIKNYKTFKKIINVLQILE